MHCLPTSITHLETQWDMPAAHSDAAAIFCRLPNLHTLNVLRIPNYMHETHVRQVSSHVRALRHFKARVSGQWIRQCIPGRDDGVIHFAKWLPSTLRTFEVCSTNATVLAHCTHLQHLDAALPDPQDAVAFLNFVPTLSLHTLCIRGHIGSLNHFLSKLPATLTDLTVISMVQTEEVQLVTVLLPPALAALRLQHSSARICIRHAQFPSTLQSLHLSSAYIISRELQTLPPTLTDLSVTVAPILHGDAIEYDDLIPLDHALGMWLPRNLRILRLKNITPFTLESGQFLPRQLECIAPTMFDYTTFIGDQVPVKLRAFPSAIRTYFENLARRFGVQLNIVGPVYLQHSQVTLPVGQPYNRFKDI